MNDTVDSLALQLAPPGSSCTLLEVMSDISSREGDDSGRQQVDPSGTSSYASSRSISTSSVRPAHNVASKQTANLPTYVIPALKSSGMAPRLSAGLARQARGHACQPAAAIPPLAVWILGCHESDSHKPLPLACGDLPLLPPLNVVGQPLHTHGRDRDTYLPHHLGDLALRYFAFARWLPHTSLCAATYTLTRCGPLTGIYSSHNSLAPATLVPGALPGCDVSPAVCFTPDIQCVLTRDAQLRRLDPPKV